MLRDLMINLSIIKLQSYEEWLKNHKQESNDQKVILLNGKRVILKFRFGQLIEIIDE